MAPEFERIPEGCLLLPCIPERLAVAQCSSALVLMQEGSRGPRVSAGEPQVLIKTPLNSSVNILELKWPDVMKISAAFSCIALRTSCILVYSRMQKRQPRPGAPAHLQPLHQLL